MSDNKLSNNRPSEYNLASELVEIVVFLNQSQSRNCNFKASKSVGQSGTQSQ